MDYEFAKQKFNIEINKKKCYYLPQYSSPIRVVPKKPDVTGKDI